MSYDEFKRLCRKSWVEDYNYLCIDRSKRRDQGRFCVCNESKKTYTAAAPQKKVFRLHKCCIQLKIEKIWKS